MSQKSAGDRNRTSASQHHFWKGSTLSSPQEPYQPGHPGPGQQQLPQQPGPYAAAGPFGLPGEEPPARRRPRLWVVLTAIGGVLLLVGLGIVILVNVAGSATNQAKGLADGFTRLVIAGDSSKAYDDYLDPALQEQLSKESFISGIASLNMDDTCEPEYNDLQVATENGVKSADIVGLITCEGRNVDLAYRFEGTDELKMTNIKLRPAA
ncbi:hypothetical protein E2R57_13770 [Arthrobacter nitrophenolicus]|uniref:Uncharacterized protein n=1 Tax=Arthrobacter nitrophenolicus TaxID=683150 RepID=A0A4R5XZ30_9MICC|nr:hypothetical protein E2R57_13770 [Arthrobacter nitrophenolicus]